VYKNNKQVCASKTIEFKIRITNLCILIICVLSLFAPLREKIWAITASKKLSFNACFLLQVLASLRLAVGFPLQSGAGRLQFFYSSFLN
jgi:hypothetical protein